MKRLIFLPLIIMIAEMSQNAFCADSSKKIALVLSGGGAKGAYEVGVWKALDEYSLCSDISLISGTSVGALNAALFACTDAERAEEVWREKVGYSSFMLPDSQAISEIARSAVRQAQNERGKRSMQDNPFGLDEELSPESAYFLNELFDGLSFFADTGRSLAQGTARYFYDYALTVSHSDGIFKRDVLLQIIADNVSLQKLKKSGIDVYAAAVEKDGGMMLNALAKLLGADNAHYFYLNEQLSEKNVQDILLASSSFPILYSSTPLSADVIENGAQIGSQKEFIDGGFDVIGGKNTPVKPAAYSSKIQTIFVVYLKSLAEIEASGNARINRSETGDKSVVEFIPSEDLGNLVSGTVNFSQENIDRLIELGYSDACAVLEENGYKRPSKFGKLLKKVFN